MAKGEHNLIELLSILDNRQKMTVKDIIKHFNVSRRTAYRYIEAIKKAVPSITVSRSYEGLTLTKRHKSIYRNTSINDTVFIIVGLKLLASLSNSHYKKKIDKIINGIFAGTGINLNEAIDFGKLFSKSKVSSKDIHLILTQAFLKIGTIEDVPVSIINANADTNMIKDIGKVCMFFDKEWFIQSKNSNESSSLPISDVMFVAITE